MPQKLAFLPIVEVVLFIFTVAAVSVVLYIFFLRHRCCLILIRHLHSGSEEPPRAIDGFKPLSILLAQSADVTSSLLSSSGRFKQPPISTCSQLRSALKVLTHFNVSQPLGEKKKKFEFGGCHVTCLTCTYTWWEPCDLRAVNRTHCVINTVKPLTGSAWGRCTQSRLYTKLLKKT